MTAIISKIKSKANVQQLPVTHERAVRDDNGTTLETKLQMIDSYYNKDYEVGNGMGKKTLPKNNGVLTQEMMSDSNTIYVIQYDYTLGENITVPANCVLEFDGGSISASGNNNTITGNKTLIESKYQMLNNINLVGTWLNDDFYVMWWNCAADGVTDDGDILHSISQTINNNGKGSLVFPKDAIYTVSIPTGPTDYSGRVPNYNVLDFDNCTVDVLMNHSTIKVIANLWTGYGVFMFKDCTFSICNGKVEGDRLTRDYKHAYVDSGACNSIYIHGGVGIVHDMELCQMPGNGLYIGTSNYTAETAPSVTIKDVNIHHVRKNGAGVTGNKYVSFKNCRFVKIGTSDNIMGTSPAAGIDFEFEGNYKYGGDMEVIDCLFDGCSKNSIMCVNTGPNRNLGWNKYTIRDCVFKDATPYLPFHIETVEGYANDYDISNIICEGNSDDTVAGSIFALPEKLKNCNVKNNHTIINIYGSDIYYENVEFLGSDAGTISFLSGDTNATFNDCVFKNIIGEENTNAATAEEFPNVGFLKTPNNKSVVVTFKSCILNNTGMYLQAIAAALEDLYPIKFYDCNIDNVFFCSVNDRRLLFDNSSLKNVRCRYQFGAVTLNKSSLTETRDVDDEYKGGYGFGNSNMVADNSVIDIKKYSRNSSEPWTLNGCSGTIIENNISKTKPLTLFCTKLTTNVPAASITSEYSTVTEPQ